MASRILVVRFGALGDLVLLTVLLGGLRRRFPSATIDVCTKGRYTSLFRNHPAVDATHALPPGGSLTELAGRLRGIEYDLKLDAHANLRSHILRSRIPGPWMTLRKPRLARFLATNSTGAARVPHVTDLYLQMVSHLDVTVEDRVPSLYPDASSQAAAKKLVSGDYVILAPGAQHATKRWPATHWRRLAEELRNVGHTVVGLGVTHEASLLGTTPTIGAFGLPLDVGVALCKRARAVIAHDSGMMHVATAVDTPAVVIYGATAPELGYAPPAGNTRCVFIDLPCRPCSVFGSRSCPAGHHECMTSLGPDKVLSALTAVS